MKYSKKNDMFLYTDHFYLPVLHVELNTSFLMDNSYLIFLLICPGSLRQTEENLPTPLQFPLINVVLHRKRSSVLNLLSFRT